MATTAARVRAQSEGLVGTAGSTQAEPHGFSLKKRKSWKSWGRRSPVPLEGMALGGARGGRDAWSDKPTSLANLPTTPAPVTDVHLVRTHSAPSTDELWIRLGGDEPAVEQSPPLPSKENSKNASRRSSEEKRTWRKPVPTLVPLEVETKVVSRRSSMRSIRSVKEMEASAGEGEESMAETLSDRASLRTAMEHDSRDEAELSAVADTVAPEAKGAVAPVESDDTESEDDFDVPMPGSLSYPSSPRSIRGGQLVAPITPPLTPTERVETIHTDSYISTDSAAVSTQDPSASDEDADSDLPLSALRSWPSPPSSPSNAAPAGESKRDRNSRRRRIKADREKRRVERVEEQRLQEIAAAEAEDIRVGTEIRERTLARRRSVRKAAAETEKAEVALGNGEFSSSQLSLSLAMVWRQSMDDLHAPMSSGSQFVEKFESEDSAPSQPESSDETPVVVKPVDAAPISSPKSPGSPILSPSPVDLVRRASRKDSVLPEVAPQLLRRQSTDRVALDTPQQWRSPYERNDAKVFAKSTSALGRLSSQAKGEENEGRSSMAQRASGLFARMSSIRRSGNISSPSLMRSPTPEATPYLTARSPYSRARGEDTDTSWSQIADDLSGSPPLPVTSSFAGNGNVTPPSDYRRTQEDSLSSVSTAPKRRSGMFLSRFRTNGLDSSDGLSSDSSGPKNGHLRSAFSSDESGANGNAAKKSKKRLSHRFGSALSQIMSFTDRMASVAPSHSPASRVDVSDAEPTRTRRASTYGGR